MPHLHTEQVVPLSLEEAFKFFEDPYNLLKITPPSLSLTVTNPKKVEMREGLVINYKLKVAGIPQRWQSVIREYNPPHCFMDVQIKGPYAKWEHTHTLKPVPGGTLIIDDVDYLLPMGWLGQLVAGWAIRLQLNYIFSYREKQIEKLLGLPPKG